jgi:uncharacterized cofD-like protein
MESFILQAIRKFLCEANWMTDRGSKAKPELRHRVNESASLSRTRRCAAAGRRLEAIENADIITLGPGSLFTSLIPNLLVKEIPKPSAFQCRQGLYPEHHDAAGETDGMTVVDHVKALMNHCGGQLLFSKIVLNTGKPSPSRLAKYVAEAQNL